MPELTNSRRRLEKVTYTPLILPETKEGGAALQTAAAVAALDLQPGEAELAEKTTQGQEQAALETMEEYVRAPDTPARLAASSKLGAFANVILAAAVDAIHVQRESILADAFKDLSSLIREYQAVQKQKALGNTLNAGQLNERLANIESQLGVLQQLPQTSRGSMPLQTSASEVFTGVALQVALPPAPLPQPPEPVATKLGKDLASVAHEAAVWADRQQPERARQFTAIPAALLPSTLRETAEVLLMHGLMSLISKASVTATVKSTLTSRELQPLGLLHLEELVITPMQVDRGELIYTLALAPNEKVTLSHKEWSLKQEEYSKFVQDYLENYSEQGVAEKTDIAVSSKSETEHTKTLSMSRPLAPGGATLADAADTATASDVTKETQSQEQSRSDTREITQKASALAIRDQRVSFTVATVSGTEDFTARLYVNKTDDKVMLVEYFRRMRKWRNQLYRTGIRLTYDVVLPDPGRRLRERWNALIAIDAELNTPFQFALGSGRSSFSSIPSLVGVAAVGAGSPFLTLGPSNNIEEMSPADIEFLARDYGVSLPPAPNTLTSREEIKAITETPPAGKDSVSFELSLDIPDDCRPNKLTIFGRLAIGGNDQYLVADYWKGRGLLAIADEKIISAAYPIADGEYTSSKLPVGFIVYKGAVGEARARVDLTPTPEAWRKWRSQAYAAIRQGAITKFNEKREVLRQKRTALYKELTAPDTLSLRRMEREQVMYTVLQWLFPEFGQSGQTYQASASAGSVLEYGEYIKFVHDAIDWDSILVLLYPYFWDRPENHAEKLYLDHADGTHKEFLRAGACRVVLAVKPGFEEAVVSLLDKGQLGALAPASRFLDTIQAVQATEKEFAKNRAAATEPNEDGDPPDEEVPPGEIIGAWYDWTPTSAMDMDVTFNSVL